MSKLRSLDSQHCFLWPICTTDTRNLHKMGFPLMNGEMSLMEIGCLLDFDEVFYSFLCSHAMQCTIAYLMRVCTIYEFI